MAGNAPVGPVEAALRLQLVKYFDVAAIALLFFDYLLTFHLERALLWPSRWSLSKVLFILSRYLVFVEIPGCLFFIFASKPSLETCNQVNSSIIMLRVVGIGIAEAILLLRTYALSGRSQRALRTFTPLWALGVSLSVVTLAVFIRGSMYDVPPLRLPGCSLVGGNFLLVGIPFIVSTAYEMALMSYTLYLGLRTYRHSMSPLLVTLYRDGIAYFVFLSGVSICNLVILIAGPAHMQDLLNNLLRSLHAICSCRIILHVRDVERKRQDTLSFENEHEREVITDVDFAAAMRTTSTGTSVGGGRGPLGFDASGSRAFTLEL